MLNKNIASNLDNHKLNLPTIGLFDSGVGGLTIAHAIYSIIPNTKFIYIADSIHAPWGDKSSSQIIDYSISLTKFLLTQQCDVIVVACNTASAVALHALRANFPNIILFNVIDPVIHYLIKLDLNNFHEIGIIGTKQTIKSEAYQTNIKKILLHQNIKRELPIKSLATPLLVSLIEEGWKDHAVSALIIQEYLSQLNLKDQSILILGCTHYPLIEQLIKNYYKQSNKRITIIHSASLVANQIYNFLLQQDPCTLTKTSMPMIIGPDHGAAHCNPAANDINQLHGVNQFYCTCNNEFFPQIAKQLFANLSVSFLPTWQLPAADLKEK
jgi:glutamate racemase